ATVTTGKRSLGMLSLSGNMLRAASARRQPAVWRLRLPARERRAPQRHVLVGVVGRTHERARGDVLEAHLVRRALELGELLRVPVTNDRKMLLGGAQVLADREHRDTVVTPPRERVEQLDFGLAQPDHQPR